MIQHVFPGLELYYRDPAQRLITAGYYLSDLSDLDHDLSDLDHDLLPPTHK